MTVVARDTADATLAEIDEAIALYRAGRLDESRECLRQFLRASSGNITALLWLARVSSDAEETAAAALLALKLDPQNPVAQRAVAQRVPPARSAREAGMAYPKALHVVTRSRYLEGEERRQRGVSSLALGVVTALFVLALLITALLIGAREFSTWPIDWWMPYIPIGVMLALWLPLNWVEQGLDTADNYRVGRWAEEDTVEELRAALDGRWTLVRNFQFPNRRFGDVDLVLVGPGGVWALEVKAYAGLVRNVGDRWERRVGRRWTNLDKHPGKQARRNAKQLHEYLAARGVPVGFVEPVVVWARKEGSITLSNPRTRVWTLDQLAKCAGSFSSGRPLSAEQIAQIVSVLLYATNASRTNH